VRVPNGVAVTKSKIAEEAWSRAASSLESDVLGRELELPPDDPEQAVLTHIREKVIPSLRQRAKIIVRNRKERP
jgi:hypothetical protein